MREEILGRRCQDNILKHVDAAGTCLCEEGCPVVETLKDGMPRTAKVFLHHEEGHRVPVRVNVMPIKDDEGAIIGAVETFKERRSENELQRKIAELEKTACLDHLSQAANRTYLEKQLRAKLSELSRYGWPFGLILLEIDRYEKFENFGDGFIAPDILRMVAATISLNLRPFDIVGRWNEARFLIMAVNVDPNHLTQLADRLRILVARSSKNLGDEEISVTMSVGAAMVRPDDDLEKVVTRVRELMNRSKEQGGDQVTIES